MFVLTERGDVYVFRIEEKMPERMAFEHHRLANTYSGELDLQNPIYVKDLKNIKQMASGVDHIMFLDNKGDV